VKKVNFEQLVPAFLL